ncbi:Wzz/FepE/Etk N-terminal domain-containing protein [Rhizobium sp. S152]|uniref:Wzz/FepE/Etk N-terminal domain-containing protein n=1 Tax=Rhizobium sp. S152 TaxID=3055038 RepID=UPI0025A9CD16|nr:Wzz/FepE/Etk N-terminal domain-containing protein [Rhizobium sp. S152]MDM9626080.1 Wzz/FepE/Etk N-terminal domain-containing protein [Rhizobium sp. S152]
MNEVTDLRMLLGLVRRQLRIIVATALIVFLSGVTVVFLLTPRFTAQALVLVDTSNKNLLDPEAASASGITDNSRVEGEVRIVQSDAVLIDAIRASDLVADPEFGPREAFLSRLISVFSWGEVTMRSADVAQGKVLATFRDALRVRREGLTYLITIGVTSEDPSKAARLANLVTDVYIRKQVDAKVASTVAARNSLQLQVEAAKGILLDNEKGLDLFLAKHGDLTAAANVDRGTELRLADARFGRFVTDANGGGDVASETLTQFYSLQQAAQIARTQYQTMLARLQDFEAQASLQMADSRIISQALAPIDPSYPRKGLMLFVLALLALFAGMGAALLREFFVGGFTSEDQVGAVLGAPLASVAPEQSGSELGKPHGRGLSDAIVSAPLSVFSESIRRIRASIDQALMRTASDSGEGIVIMVSSALPGEGKSTLATALARTYALAGRRTLLIDCDLRKPSIHRHVDREPMPAFVNLLRGQPDPGLANMVVTDSATSLSVILGARPAEFPTDDLLMNPKVNTLLERARQHFDYIIIDTPPIETAVDALYLARLCDAVLFVVRWASTPQSAARKALSGLRGSLKNGAPVVAVLNRQDRRAWFDFSLEPTKAG